MSECIECGDKDGPWANICEACSVRIDNATMKLAAQVAALTEQRDAARAACNAWAEVFSDAEGTEVSFVAVVEKQKRAMDLTLAAIAQGEAGA